MTRQVLYVAAPLRPTEDEIAAAPKYNEGGRSPAPRSLLVERALRANLDRAMRWLAWIRRSFPETTFIAPWIFIVLSGDDDGDPAVRERAMQDNCAVIERCDGIVLVGGRISEGMRREMEHGMMRHKIWVDPADQFNAFRVYSLADLREPPLGTFVEPRPTFQQYAQAHEDS